MTKKIHINWETGETGKCSAKMNNCPFGTPEEHFSSINEAQKYYEEHNTNQSFSKINKIPKKEVEHLITELSNAAEAYYLDKGEVLLSDEDFDSKQEYLQSISDSGEHSEFFEKGSKGFLILEGNPALGAEIDNIESDIVIHDLPMLSLQKAKKEKELYSFLDKAREAGASSFRLQTKLDGIAISVTYNNGKLIRIATRGDGEIGEDATYLVKDPNVTINGLPTEIAELEPIEVRGELFFTNEQFKSADDERSKITGSRFKNSRNSASGLLKKAKKGVGYPIEFTYTAYSTFSNKKMIDLDTLSEKDGFLSVDQLSENVTKKLNITELKTNNEVAAAIKKFGEYRENFNIPTDGVVIKPTNESEMYESMGLTSHHPSSQIAWKYPSEKAKTVILEINMTVGKSGRVTPIAKVEKVLLDGSEISNASLHNFNYIASKDIRVGSIVLIEKANEIIPQVVTVLYNDEEETLEIVTPKTCPSCSTELIAKTDENIWPPKTLNCPNINCPSREFFALKTAVGKNFLDIDHLSEVSLTHFNEIGRINDISDLYTLTEEELANSVNGYSPKGNPRRLGEKTSKHILKYLEKSKNLPMTKILPALNIDGLGHTTSKTLVEEYKNLDAILEAKEEDMSLLENIGPISAKGIYEGLKNKEPLIRKLQKQGVKFNGPVEKNNKLSGISFSISGKVPKPFSSRDKWIDFIEENGGKFDSAPKASTSFIIANESESSSKVKKAKNLGTKFLTAEEFTNQFS